MTTNAVWLDEHMRAGDFARRMLESTDADGNLMILNWRNVADIEHFSERHYRCKMAWDTDAFAQFLLEMQAEYDNLYEIAPYLEELDGTEETAQRVLVSDTLVATYMLFVKPLEGETDEEQEHDLIGRGFGGEVVITRETYQIVRRGCEVPSGKALILHAGRLCRLMAMEAPGYVMWHEARMLMASAAINRFGISMEEIDFPEEYRA